MKNLFDIICVTTTSIILNLKHRFRHFVSTIKLCEERNEENCYARVFCSNDNYVLHIEQPAYNIRA